jgi:hypothetical protein
MTPIRYGAYDFRDGLRKSAGKVETGFRGEKREWLPKSLALLTTPLKSHRVVGNNNGPSIEALRAREGES